MPTIKEIIWLLVIRLGFRLLLLGWEIIQLYSNYQAGQFSWDTVYKPEWQNTEYFQ